MQFISSIASTHQPSYQYRKTSTLLLLSSLSLLLSLYFRLFFAILQQKLRKFLFTLLQNIRNMKPTYSFSKYHPGVNPTHPGFKTRPPHDVFPEDIECVYEDQTTRKSIFIGNLEAAESLDTLKKHRIQSILTACKNIHIKHPKEHVPFSLYIPGEDHENYDLSMHFDTAINFIHESLKETNILVHCMAGVSRSVTLVLAYLIKHKGMAYNQAYKHVLKNRNKINPNPGFIRQLQRWEQKHNNVQRSRTRYSAEHTDTAPKSKYDNLYKPKVYSYKDIENVENNSKYKVPSYSKYGNLSHLHQSPTRNYNPQYESSFSKTNSSFNTTLKAPYESIPRNNSNERLKEVLNTMNTTQKSSYPQTSINRERSIENLSRDLDSRIAKIKQKYYETSNNSYESRKMNTTDYDQRWGVSHIQERKVSGYDGLARSRASRQSLRSSIYTPYNATRAITYQYS